MAAGHGPAAVPVPGREHASRGELLGLAMELPGTSSRQARWRRAEAVTFVLDWLEGFPGGSWQDRWLLSGADERGRSWGPAGPAPPGHSPPRARPRQPGGAPPLR